MMLWVGYDREWTRNMATAEHLHGPTSPATVATNRKASFHVTPDHLDYLATLNRILPNGWTAGLDRYGRIYYTK